MQVRVITIRDHADSERCAARTITSGAKFGVTVERFDAIIPAHDPLVMMNTRGFPTGKFTKNRFSRAFPCMACFLSHAELWHQCAFSGESFIILEHDAVFVRPLPDLDCKSLLVNLGKPSFGTFRQPPHGFGPLFSKPHMPGAHAYFLRPNGAKELLRLARTQAEPADVFMSLKRFPWLREYYPWPVECEDDVTTVQAEEGCRGKHRPVRIV